MPRIEDYNEDISLSGSEKILLSDNGTVKNTTLAKIKDFFNLGSIWGGITGNISDQEDLKNALDNKQDTLVSGTNIKTINGKNILGGGNIIITGSGTVDLYNYYDKSETDLLIDEKSDINHNHTLSGLSEKSYNSLDDKPDLSIKVDKVTGSSLVADTKVTSYDNHLVDTSNPHSVTALQVGAYTTTQTDTLLSAKEDKANNGVPNGYASLDSNGKVPLAQISDSILGQLEYMGIWDFTTTPPTATQKGQYWVVSVGGNGYESGDWAVYNGATFDKVDNTDAVSSVAGRTGNVVLTKSDVGLGNVDNTSDVNKPISKAQQQALDNKQDTLSSGVNIKTINGSDIVGSGNLTVSADATMQIVQSSNTATLDAISNLKPFVLVKENDLSIVPTTFINGLPVRFGYEAIFEEDCFATKINNTIKYIKLKDL